MITSVDRGLCVAAAICGAAGVAFSAIATHSGGGSIATGASFLLMHAPAFLAVGLLGASRWLRFAAWLLFLGVALFAGDLIVRHYGAPRLFPMAAPGGGVLMILGWIAIGVASLLPRRA